MAQLKDTIINGDLNVANSLTTDSIDMQTIKISGNYYRLKIVMYGEAGSEGEEGAITFVLEE